MPKKKLQSISKLKKVLWEFCKQIIRLRFGNKCFTCGTSNLEGSNWQTGHFIPSSICGVSLRWELRNLRPQCFRCNISLGGNGTIFYKRLVETMGQQYVDELFRMKEIKNVVADRQFLDQKIAEYKNILETN